MREWHVIVKVIQKTKEVEKSANATFQPRSDMIPEENQGINQTDKGQKVKKAK